MKLIELRVLVVVTDDNVKTAGWAANAIGVNLDFDAGEDVISCGVVTIEENYKRVENDSSCPDCGADGGTQCGSINCGY